MATVGLTLQWEHRISSVAGEGGPRVEPSEIAAGQNRENTALPDDAALAAGCQAGDLRAYERLYQLQGARMRNLARNLLGSQTDAEDAVQDTFLKIQRGIGSFRGQSTFVTWAFRILGTHAMTFAAAACVGKSRGRMIRTKHSPEWSRALLALTRLCAWRSNAPWRS
jgi:hypothetical protein